MDVGVARSMSRLELACICREGPAGGYPRQREGWKGRVRAGGRSARPQTSLTTSLVSGNLQDSQKGFLRYIIYKNSLEKPFSSLFFTVYFFYAELGFRMAGSRLLGPGRTELTPLIYSAGPTSLQYT